MYRRILVPIDDSAGSRAAADHAVRLAAALGAELILVHVLEPLPSHGYFALDALAYGEQLRGDLRKAAQRMLDEAAETAADGGVEATTRLVEGIEPSRAIAEVVDDEDADLVVMGTHGRRGLGRAILGSVAEAVVRRASVPHLLIRQPDD